MEERKSHNERRPMNRLCPRFLRVTYVILSCHHHRKQSEIFMDRGRATARENQSTDFVPDSCRGHVLSCPIITISNSTGIMRVSQPEPAHSRTKPAGHTAGLDGWLVVAGLSRSRDVSATSHSAAACKVSCDLWKPRERKGLGQREGERAQ